MSRRKRNRGRKSGWCSLFPALVIETLAVAAIVMIFFGMRADLRRQDTQQAFLSGAPQAVAQSVGQRESSLPFARSQQWPGWGAMAAAN